MAGLRHRCEDDRVHDDSRALAGMVGGSDEQLLAALSVPALTVDLSARVVHANRAAAHFLDVQVSELLDRPLHVALCAEPEHGALDDILRKVLAGGRWQGELPVLGRDRHARRTMVTVAALFDVEQVVGALVTVEDVTASRGRAARLAERLTRLAEVTAELLGASDVRSVTRIVTEHMADAAGATVSSLSLLADENTLRLVAIRGAREGAERRWETFPLVGTPAGEAASTRRTVVLSGRDEIHARYPDLETAAEGERSIVCLPLVVGDRVIGVTSLSFPGRQSFDAAEMEFFRVMADTCAQALDRVNALAQAADQRTKLEFLAEATTELASSLDYESTLRKVARLAVPWFADWCSIALAVDGELHTLEVAHVDPDKVALAREFQRRYPADPEAGRGSYEVYRTGHSELTTEITDEMLEAGIPDAEHRAMVRELNLYSAMSVPLKVGD